MSPPINRSSGHHWSLSSSFHFHYHLTMLESHLYLILPSQPPPGSSTSSALPFFSSLAFSSAESQSPSLAHYKTNDPPLRYLPSPLLFSVDKLPQRMIYVACLSLPLFRTWVGVSSNPGPSNLVRADGESLPVLLHKLSAAFAKTSHPHPSQNSPSPGSSQDPRLLHLVLILPSVLCINGQQVPSTHAELSR